MTAKSKAKKSALKKSSPKTRSNNVAPVMRLRKLNRQQKKHRNKGRANQKSLPAAWIILINSLKHLYKNKKLFLGILAIYAILDILFIKGLSGFQMSSLKEQVADTFGQELGSLGRGVALFSLLVGSTATAPSEAAGAYQTIVVTMVSLALIWALRVTYSKKDQPKVRDAFYEGMYPIVPFFIVLFLVLLQLVPFAIGSTLYSTVQGGGIITSGLEHVIWLTVLILSAAVSLYFVSSSTFALYIVTLSGSRPMTALRSARKLVKFRRWLIIRKLLFLPVALLVFSGIVLIPLIILFAPAAEVLFMVLSILMLAIVHSYLYTLYRELL